MDFKVKILNSRGKVLDFNVFSLIIFWFENEKAKIEGHGSLGRQQYFLANCFVVNFTFPALSCCLHYPDRAYSVDAVNAKLPTLLLIVQGKGYTYIKIYRCCQNTGVYN